jgi:hypothetical protein
MSNPTHTIHPKYPFLPATPKPKLIRRSKRTVQTKEAHGLPLRSNSFNNSGESVWPDKASSSTLRKKKKGKEDGTGANIDRENSQKVKNAPRVELNIRNSLMLPGYVSPLYVSRWGSALKI